MSTKLCRNIFLLPTARLKKNVLSTTRKDLSHSLFKSVVVTALSFQYASHSELKNRLSADNKQNKRLLEPPFELVFYGIHTDVSRVYMKRKKMSTGLPFGDSVDIFFLI